MMNKKEKLMEQLKDIELKEEQSEENKEKKKNYEKFKDRVADWVVGKAHCDIEFQQDSKYHLPNWRRN